MAHTSLGPRTTRRSRDPFPLRRCAIGERASESMGTPTPSGERAPGSTGPPRPAGVAAFRAGTLLGSVPCGFALGWDASPIALPTGPCWSRGRCFQAVELRCDFRGNSGTLRKPQELEASPTRVGRAGLGPSPGFPRSRGSRRGGSCGHTEAARGLAGAPAGSFRCLPGVGRVSRAGSWGGP